MTASKMALSSDVHLSEVGTVSFVSNWLNQSVGELIPKVFRH